MAISDVIRDHVVNRNSSARTAALLLIAVSTVIAALYFLQQPTAVVTLPYRPVEGRLVGFSYAPWKSPISELPAAARAATRATAARILMRTDTRQIASSDRAIARLVAGAPAAAVAELERLAISTPNNPNVWSDLAVARHEAARATHDGELLTLALDAADRAIELNPSLAEALFNRAVIIETMGLRLAAIETWRKYLTIDCTSPWSDDARQRLRLDHRPTHMQEWREAEARFRTAVAANNIQRAKLIVNQFPEEARTWAEVEYLFQWAVLQSTNPTESDARLKEARTIGDSLEERSSETLLRDAVAAIDKGDKALLAQAQITYHEGRALYGQRKISEAVPLLRLASARFEASGSSLALVARYYLANTEIDTDNARHALEILDGIHAPTSYRALKANVLWTRGTALTRLGRLGEAIEALQASSAEFDSLGEPDSATRVRVGLAALWSRVGQLPLAWKERLRTFTGATESGTSGVVELALNTVARGEIRERHYDTARPLLAIQARLKSASPRLRFDALLWRAFVTAQMANAKPTDFEVLRRAALLIPGGPLREDALDDTRFAEALDLSDRDPRRARTLLDKTIAFRSAHHRQLRLAEAFVERAKCARKLQDDSAALKDFERAVHLIEEQHRSIGSEDVRDSFLGISSRAYLESADLAAARSDFHRAFDIFERSRSQMAAERVSLPASPISLPHLSTVSLPAGVTVEEILSLPDRVVIMSTSRAGTRATTITRSQHAIQAEVVQFTAALRRGDEEETARMSADLFSTLIAPVIVPERPELLVIVPDEVTEAIPFNCLVNPKTGHYLVEDQSVVVAPTMNFYLRSAKREADSRATSDVLLMGDPALSQYAVRNGLARLPAAAAEVRTVARLYPHATVLLASNATRQRFFATVSSNDLVQISAHAVTSVGDAASSGIVLAPSAGDSGILTLHDIAALTLPRAPRVILAGCRTAARSAKYGAMSNLASAFLFAGARSVLATLWDVDDVATQRFIVKVQQKVACGATLGDALRRTQIEMIRGNDPAMRSTFAWSAFQVYGSAY